MDHTGLTWNKATSCGSGRPISRWSRTRLLTCDSISSTCTAFKALGVLRLSVTGLIVKPLGCHL